MDGWKTKICTTRMRSSRMRTACSLPYRGGGPRGFLSRGLCPGGLYLWSHVPSGEISLTETPRQRPPWTETPDRDPLDKDPPLDRDRAWHRPPEQKTSPPKEHGTRQPDMKWHHAETPSLSCEQKDWQTGVKTLPSPQLRLRAVSNIRMYLQ